MVFDGRSSIATAPDAANLDLGNLPIRVAARFALARVPDPGQTFDVIRKGDAAWIDIG